MSVTLCVTFPLYTENIFIYAILFCEYCFQLSFLYCLFERYLLDIFIVGTVINHGKRGSSCSRGGLEEQPGNVRVIKAQVCGVRGETGSNPVSSPGIPLGVFQQDLSGGLSQSVMGLKLFFICKSFIQKLKVSNSQNLETMNENRGWSCAY